MYYCGIDIAKYKHEATVIDKTGKALLDSICSMSLRTPSKFSRHSPGSISAGLFVAPFSGLFLFLLLLFFLLTFYSWSFRFFEAPRASGAHKASYFTTQKAGAQARRAALSPISSSPVPAAHSLSAPPPHGCPPVQKCPETSAYPPSVRRAEGLPFCTLSRPCR